jgi:hemolysin activation/secretion protein
LISRRAFRDNVGDYVYKIQNYEAKYLLKYPFSEVASVRLTANARYDLNSPLSVDQASLEAPNEHDIYGGLKLEYVYDITRSVATNIRYGTRFKLWGEYMQQIDEQQSDFFTFGLDFRHYQKIHRTLVFATRFAASTSLGSQRLVYFMGGVDNWMGAKFDNSIQISPNENYQFQTIATPMRGFHQNARNGNTFAVLNNELRFPIFKYLAKNPIRSDFISNFMIIGFADIGSAWTGKNPYDLENSFNTTVIDGKNYEVILNNQKEPIVYGYGGGLRSKILGYYVRFDLAWGVDDGVVLKPVSYFSLALDF